MNLLWFPLGSSYYLQMFSLAACPRPAAAMAAELTSGELSHGSSIGNGVLAENPSMQNKDVKCISKIHTEVFGFRDLRVARLRSLLGAAVLKRTSCIV